MTLVETLTADYMAAFKNKETIKKMSLNMVLAQVKNKKIDLGRDPEEEEILAIIKKEVKAVKEAKEYLEKAGKDLSEEDEKLAVLQKYLPQLMSEEETRKVVEEIIAKLEIEDVNKERGKLMGAIMTEYKGKIDGSLVNQLINNR